MTEYFLYIFAAAFLIIGFVRVVEFKSSGVPRNQRFVLIPIHIIGTLAFTTAIILLARDRASEKTLLTWAFATGVLILFPLHIYVGIKRRLLINKD